MFNKNKLSKVDKKLLEDIFAANYLDYNDGDGWVEIPSSFLKYKGEHIPRIRSDKKRISTTTYFLNEYKEDKYCINRNVIFLPLFNMKTRDAKNPLLDKLSLERMKSLNNLSQYKILNEYRESFEVLLSALSSVHTQEEKYIVKDEIRELVDGVIKISVDELIKELPSHDTVSSSQLISSIKGFAQKALAEGNEL